MQINNLQECDIPQLYDIYGLIHHENSKEEIKSYVDHWLDKISNSMEYVSIQKEGDEIVGQNFFSPMSFFFNGVKIDSFWGFDLYVKEKYRKENYGVYLLMYDKKKYKNDFATGSGPDAMALIGKLGGKQIGEIRKYVGITNPLLAISSVFRGIVPIDKFPDRVNVSGMEFIRIEKNQLPDISSPYNCNLLEISHDSDFLRWKFFESYREYAFYLNKDTGNYAVFRTIIKKHITMLMITDFRCNLSTTEEFETLYQVANKVAKHIGIAFIYCGSSLSIVDEVFDKHHFKTIGRHRPIITYDKECKKSAHNDRIASRQFALVTLADSDGEPL